MAVIVLAVGIHLCATVIMDGYHTYRDTVAGMSLEGKMTSTRGKEDYTTYRELPEIYVDAVLSVEDHRSYDRPGIDVIATGRAVFNDIRAGALVGDRSTMTQQLARNTYFTQERELQYKVAEVFVTFDLERNYNKNEVLELYMNTIYYGSGYYCVKDASQRYFEKEPRDTTDYESTLLARIPNALSKYAPTISQELADKRQEQVLARLMKCGHLTKEWAPETLAAGNML